MAPTTSLSLQAMQVMDQDGEPAMWAFIAEHLQAKSTQRQEPPKTARMEDGSLIHLSDNSYTFIDDGTHGNPDQAPEKRKSIKPQELIPGIFQPAQPLHIWPSQEHLYQALVQMALDQEWDKLHPNQDAPCAENLHQLLPEALYEVHNWTPMSNPGSQYLIDDLEAYLTGLAGDIFQAMGKERQKLLTNRVSHMVAALHEKA